MSNLAPVARVDKNGHVVTRHMKLDEGVKPAVMLPPVTLTSNKENLSVDDANRKLLDTVYGDESDDNLFENHVPGLKVIREFSGDTCINDILTLLQSDSEAGNRELRRVAQKAIAHATETAQYDRESARFDNSVFEEGGFYESDFKRSWAVADVYGSLGEVDMSPERVKEVRIAMDNLRNNITYRGRNMLSPTAQYWRGMTALHESRVSDFPTDEARAEARDFVKWAGERDDIALVIDTARERKTVNVRIIGAIIDIGRDVPTLIDGAL